MASTVICKLCNKSCNKKMCSDIIKFSQLTNVFMRTNFLETGSIEINYNKEFDIEVVKKIFFTIYHIEKECYYNGCFIQQII